MVDVVTAAIVGIAILVAGIGIYRVTQPSEKRDRSMPVIPKKKKGSLKVPPKFTVAGGLGSS
jgi:hypothetical protein